VREFSAIARPGRIRPAYVRSHLFWWGIGLLAIAAVLMGWNAIRDTTATTTSDLQTIEGKLIDYSGGGKTSTRYAGKPGKRHRGSGRRANILRIEKPDGTIAEFSSRDWIAPPKSGWRSGQPVRVRYDSRGNLYEVVVGNETLRDVTMTMQRREEERADIDRIAVFLLVIGGTLMLIAYFTSGRGKTARAPSPRA
jgi:hypothetical protein